MKIKHHSYFNNGMETLNWRELRNSKNDKDYYIPFDKEDYLSTFKANEPSNLTKIIIKELENEGIKKIFSIGSGIAALEYQLKKFSNLNIVISDFNSSVLRLKQFEIFDDALILDAIQDPFPVDDSFSVLFPRIDTEFDDEKFQKIFEKCHSLGVKHICFIPGELLSVRIVLAEIKTLLISKIKRKPRVFCGYARSMSSFVKIWNPYYKVSKVYKSDRKIFFLKKK